MKIATILFGTLLVLSTMGYSLFPTHAATIESTNAAMATTERNIADTVSNSAGDVQALQEHLDTPQQLPKDLQAFDRTTTRLHNLRADLTHNITAYNNAVTTKLAGLDRELQAIHDSTTQRQMERLRDHAYTQSQERLISAQEELSQLDDILVQGADLQHAAKCVQLSDELTTQGDDLETQIARITEQATQYASTTNNLLARLTTDNE